MTSVNAFDPLVLDPVSLLIGAVAGVLIAVAILVTRIVALEKEKAAASARSAAEAAGLEDRFKTLSQTILDSNVRTFLTLAQDRLATTASAVAANAVNDFDKRAASIAQMVKPVEAQLTQLKTAVDQLQGTDKAIRDDLQSLGRETARLTGALKNPAAQGKWGEFVLETLLERANLIKGQHYETQVSLNAGKQRPDAVIRLQDGFCIAVDAKAPINDFVTRMEEDLSSADIAAIQLRLAQQIRAHIRALGAKGYWESLDSPDFVVLFLPSESVFSAALMADTGIVDFASENNVIIASPTLMLSLLRVVRMGWRQADTAKNAQMIADMGAELYKRLSSFAGHFSKIGKSLGAAIEAHDSAIGSLERSVFPAARKFEKLQSIKANANIAQPARIDRQPRKLASPDAAAEDPFADDDDTDQADTTHAAL